MELDKTTTNRRKRAQEKAQVSETPLTTHAGIPQSPKLEAMMYKERTWFRPAQSLWVHVSFIRVGLEDLDFLVTHPLWLLNSLCLLIWGFPDPWGEGSDGDIPFRVECSKVSHSLLCIDTLSTCEFFYPFSTTAEGRSSDGGWASHWSMSIAECPQESFYWYSPLLEE